MKQNSTAQRKTYIVAGGAAEAFELVRSIRPQEK
jgi:hypothetical protein